MKIIYVTTYSAQICACWACVTSWGHCLRALCARAALQAARAWGAEQREELEEDASGADDETSEFDEEFRPITGLTAHEAVSRVPHTCTSLPVLERVTTALVERTGYFAAIYFRAVIESIQKAYPGWEVPQNACASWIQDCFIIPPYACELPPALAPVAMAGSQHSPVANAITYAQLMAAPVPGPGTCPPLMLHRRELPWSDSEVLRFAAGYARVGKDFYLIGGFVGTHTVRHVIAFYYGAWRNTSFYRASQADKEQRTEVQATEEWNRYRARAWFHFWRFDEAALIQQEMSSQRLALPAEAQALPELLLAEPLFHDEGPRSAADLNAKASSEGVPVGVTMPETAHDESARLALQADLRQRAGVAEAPGVVHSRSLLHKVHESTVQLDTARAAVAGQPSWTAFREIDNEPVCALCGDGGDMVCCEGSCRRSFHVDCVEQLVNSYISAAHGMQYDDPVIANALDMSRDDWACVQCATGVQECFLCGRPGVAGVHVHSCQRMCGKFYHVKCVASDPRTRFFGREHEQVLAGGTAHAAFACPFHACSVCGAAVDAFKPLAPVYRCHTCPTAYHAACAPGGTRHEVNEVISCKCTVAHRAKRQCTLRYTSAFSVHGVDPQLADEEEEFGAGAPDAPEPSTGSGGSAGAVGPGAATSAEEVASAAAARAEHGSQGGSGAASSPTNSGAAAGATGTADQSLKQTVVGVPAWYRQGTDIPPTAITFEHGLRAAIAAARAAAQDGRELPGVPNDPGSADLMASVARAADHALADVGPRSDFPLWLQDMCDASVAELLTAPHLSRTKAKKLQQVVALHSLSDPHLRRLLWIAAAKHALSRSLDTQQRAKRAVMRAKAATQSEHRSTHATAETAAKAAQARFDELVAGADEPAAAEIATTHEAAVFTATLALPPGSPNRGMSSKLQGVRRVERDSPYWQARVNYESKPLPLGEYDSEIGAAIALDAGSFRLRGDKAQLTFPFGPPPHAARAELELRTHVLPGAAQVATARRTFLDLLPSAFKLIPGHEAKYAAVEAECAQLEANGVQIFHTNTGGAATAPPTEANVVANFAAATSPHPITAARVPVLPEPQDGGMEWSELHGIDTQLPGTAGAAKDVFRLDLLERWAKHVRAVRRHMDGGGIDRAAVQRAVREETYPSWAKHASARSQAGSDDDDGDGADAASASEQGMDSEEEAMQVTWIDFRPYSTATSEYLEDQARARHFQPLVRARADRARLLPRAAEIDMEYDDGSYDRGKREGAALGELPMPSIAQIARDPSLAIAPAPPIALDYSAARSPAQPTVSRVSGRVRKPSRKVAEAARVVSSAAPAPAPAAAAAAAEESVGSSSKPSAGSPELSPQVGVKRRRSARGRAAVPEGFLAADRLEVGAADDENDGGDSFSLAPPAADSVEQAAAASAVIASPDQEESMEAEAAPLLTQPSDVPSAPAHASSSGSDDQASSEQPPAQGWPAEAEQPALLSDADVDRLSRMPVLQATAPEPASIAQLLSEDQVTSRLQIAVSDILQRGREFVLEQKPIETLQDAVCAATLAAVQTLQREPRANAKDIVTAQTVPVLPSSRGEALERLALSGPQADVFPPPHRAAERTSATTSVRAPVNNIVKPGWRWGLLQDCGKPFGGGVADMRDVGAAAAAAGSSMGTAAGMVQPPSKLLPAAVTSMLQAVLAAAQSDASTQPAEHPVLGNLLHQCCPHVHAPCLDAEQASVLWRAAHVVAQSELLPRDLTLEDPEFAALPLYHRHMLVLGYSLQEKFCEAALRSVADSLDGAASSGPLQLSAGVLQAMGARLGITSAQAFLLLCLGVLMAYGQLLPAASGAQAQSKQQDALAVLVATLAPGAIESSSAASEQAASVGGAPYGADVRAPPELVELLAALMATVHCQCALPAAPLSSS